MQTCAWHCWPCGSAATTAWLLISCANRRIKCSIRLTWPKNKGSPPRFRPLLSGIEGSVRSPPELSPREKPPRCSPWPGHYPGSSLHGKARSGLQNLTQSVPKGHKGYSPVRRYHRSLWHAKPASKSIVLPIANYECWKKLQGFQCRCATNRQAVPKDRASRGTGLASPLQPWPQNDSQPGSLSQLDAQLFRGIPRPVSVLSLIPKSWSQSEYRCLMCAKSQTLQSSTAGREILRLRVAGRLPESV